ncbi:MAG: Crp/Fnr family transcriptional regulator [Bacteroidota bacterium]
MEKKDSNINKTLKELDERTKELNCIYKVDEILNEADLETQIVFAKLLEVIPEGWQFPEICKVKIEFNGDSVSSEGYKKTDLKLSTNILLEGTVAGTIEIVYIKPIKSEKGIFRPGELKLLNIIAEKIGNFFLLRQLKQTIHQLEQNSRPESGKKIQIVDKLHSWLKEMELNEEEISLLTRVQVKFKKGETMCKQGAFTSYVMLLSEGLSKNYLEGNQERGFNFKIVKPFDFIGLSSLYGRNYYHFSGSALTPASVFIIEKEVFRNIILKNSLFAARIMSWYCNITESHLNRLSSIANKQALGRIAEMLLYLSEIFESPLIRGTITRKDIAELAAMSTESAVRILSDLKKDGIINIINNDIEIVDAKFLQKLSLAG